MLHGPVECESGSSQQFIPYSLLFPFLLLRLYTSSEALVLNMGKKVPVVGGVEGAPDTVYQVSLKSSRLKRPLLHEIGADRSSLHRPITGKTQFRDDG